MKTFAFVLLCALAAVQGRHTGLQSTRSAAALGENPSTVHLRIAVSTSGLLNTCAGSLIGNRWVLTAASCVADARFIWSRFGVVNVINPSLVLEIPTSRTDPTGTLALLPFTRDVQETDNIRIINPAGEAGDSGKVCLFGEKDGNPGENLNCFEVAVTQNEDGELDVTGLQVSRHDVGAPLVNNGAQVGVLVDDSGNFVATAKYVEWLEEETGLNFTAETVPEVAPEAVHFV